MHLIPGMVHNKGHGCIGHLFLVHKNIPDSYLNDGTPGILASHVKGSMLPQDSAA